MSSESRPTGPSSIIPDVDRGSIRPIGLGCTGTSAAIACVFAIGDGVSQADIGKIALGTLGLIYLRKVSSAPNVNNISLDNL